MFVAAHANAFVNSKLYKLHKLDERFLGIRTDENKTRKQKENF